MSDDGVDREYVEKALEYSHGNQVVEHYLKQALGQDTDVKEVGEHLFIEGRKWCIISGCDMPKKYIDLIASDYNCPTPTEAYDMDACINPGFKQ